MKKFTYTALAIGLGLAMQAKTSVASLLPIEDACKQGDYVKMLSLMEEEAQKQGKFQLHNQYTLANTYAKGEMECGSSGEKIHFPPNIHKAIRWYERIMFSKETKFYEPYSAKWRLADIYYLGKEGVEKNGNLAKRYYQELANLSDAVIQQLEDYKFGEGLEELKGLSRMVVLETRGNARRRLAQMYYFGMFMPQDYQKAYQWASKGLGDNNPYAGQMVAVMQYEGRGTTQNRQKATELMGKLCDTGFEQQACDLYQDMRANRPLQNVRL